MTMWQVRRISNCVQSCASTRRRSCASTSRQNSVIIDGMDSGAICGQCSWDTPNNDINARAGPFMCKMRADEESTIMPESGEGRRGGCLVSIPETPFGEKLSRFCWGDCGMDILLRKWYWDIARVAPGRWLLGAVIIPHIRAIKVTV